MFDSYHENATIAFNCSAALAINPTETDCDKCTVDPAGHQVISHSSPIQGSPSNGGCWVFAPTYPVHICDNAFQRIRGPREDANDPQAPFYHYYLSWWNAFARPANAKCVSIYCDSSYSVDNPCPACDGQCETADDPPGALGDFDNLHAYDHPFDDLVTWQNSGYAGGASGNQTLNTITYNEWCTQTLARHIV